MSMWQRFQARNRRVLTEVTRLRVELAPESKLIAPFPILPKIRPKTGMIIRFWLLVGCVAVANWCPLKAVR